MLNRELAIKQGFTRKRCPKCGGNIYLDRDIHDWYEGCLQCGHISYLPTVVEMQAKDAKAICGQARAYSQPELSEGKHEKR